MAKFGRSEQLHFAVQARETIGPLDDWTSERYSLVMGSFETRGLQKKHSSTQEVVPYS